LRKLFSLLVATVGMFASIGIGCFAAALLYDELEEHYPVAAVLLLLVGVLAIVGAFVFLFRFLRQIGPNS
jgi:drug/metabolite transporter (DMT)-like permease